MRVLQVIAVGIESCCATQITAVADENVVKPPGILETPGTPGLVHRLMIKSPAERNFTMIVNETYAAWRVPLCQEGIDGQYQREQRGLISAESRAVSVDFYRGQMAAAQNLLKIVNGQPID